MHCINAGWEVTRRFQVLNASYRYVIFILLIFLALVSSESAYSSPYYVFGLSDERESINYYNEKGQKDGELTEEYLSDHFHDILVIGYDSQRQMAEMQLPDGTTYFVRARDIQVEDSTEWSKLVQARSMTDPVLCLPIQTQSGQAAHNQKRRVAKGLTSCRGN